MDELDGDLVAALPVHADAVARAIALDGFCGLEVCLQAHCKNIWRW